VFVLAGLAFKISAVPFHMWTPDVYEGAPTPVTTFFASAPKVAAVALTTRVAIEAFGTQVDAWRQVVIFAALASIVVGALGAIGQANLKRLLAYSSINNVGFILIGLACGDRRGRERDAGLPRDLRRDDRRQLRRGADAQGRDGEPLEGIADLAGLGWTRRRSALCLRC
jgi:NADH-quinone oxidoreductase subunit N